jgi:hypothetical protein
VEFSFRYKENTVFESALTTPQTAKTITIVLKLLELIVGDVQFGWTIFIEN